MSLFLHFVLFLTFSPSCSERLNLKNIRPMTKTKCKRFPSNGRQSEKAFTRLKNQEPPSVLPAFV